VNVETGLVEPLLTDLMALARERNVTVAQVVREALLAYVNQHRSARGPAAFTLVNGGRDRP